MAFTYYTILLYYKQTITQLIMTISAVSRASKGGEEGDSVLGEGYVLGGLCSDTINCIGL